VAQIATGAIDEALTAKSGRVRSGKAGAKARAEKLTGEERVAIAKRAAAARWKKGREMSQINRMVNTLFQGSEQGVSNVKFFLGDQRATAEEVAEQVNAVFAQERAGVTTVIETLDSDLNETDTLRA